MRKEDQRVKDVNEKLKTKLESTKNQFESKDSNQMENEAKKMVLFILFKVHHLLRTDREGILSDYNSRLVNRFISYFKIY